jgi:hypothetical protein
MNLKISSCQKGNLGVKKHTKMTVTILTLKMRPIGQLLSGNAA